jgi:hypothetical protein
MVDKRELMGCLVRLFPLFWLVGILWTNEPVKAGGGQRANKKAAPDCLPLIYPGLWNIRSCANPVW